MRSIGFLCVTLWVLIISAAYAEDIKLDVSQKNCTRIEKHVAAANVAYQGGVDVRGNPVISADIGTNKIKLPDSITIDLSLPLQDLFKLANPPKRSLQNAEVQVGTLDYNLLSGKLTFNGQELADPAMHEIAEKCRELYGDANS